MVAFLQLFGAPGHALFQFLIQLPQLLQELFMTAFQEKGAGGDVHAVITEPLKQDTLLSTSGGNVVVELVKDAGFLLDASTSGGDVKASGLTITIEKGGTGKSRLVGSVNGGGPRLKLRSSGGDATIRTR